MRIVQKDPAPVPKELIAELARVAGSQEDRAPFVEMLPQRDQFPTWTVSEKLNALVPKLPTGASWNQVKREVLEDRYRSQGERLIDDLSLKFLKETWTEEWIAAECRQARIADVTVGRVYNPPDSKAAKFEIDVTGRVGHRPVVISVTRGDRREAKNKVLELQHRAEQLGGSLAFAVFAWFHEKSENEATLRELWEECSFGWSSPSTFRVLGLAHLRGDAAFIHCRKEHGVLVPKRQTIQQMLTSFRTASES